MLAEMTPPALPVLLTWPFHPSSDPHSASPVCVCVPCSALDRATELLLLVELL